MTDVAQETTRPHVPQWPVVTALALGVAMVIMDGTLVGVSLPVMITDLRLTFAQAQCVNTGYVAVSAALLITAGRLGDRFGRRPVLILGVLIFVAGALIAAAADAPEPLIWGRIVQGAGAAGVLGAGLPPLSESVRARVFPTGSWGVLVAVAAMAGALLGGWFGIAFSWPWIFILEVALGAVVLVLVVLVVPETRPAGAELGLDVDGLLLGAAGAALVVFALVEGQVYGWWRPLTDFHLFGGRWSTAAPLSPAPVLLVLGVLLLAMFLRWEVHRIRVRRPALVSRELLRNSVFGWGTAVVTLTALAEFGLLFVVPLFLVDVLDLSILRVGVVLAVLAAGALFGALAVRGPAAGYEPEWVLRAGLTIEIVAVAVLTLCGRPQLSVWLLGALLAAYGIGSGLVSSVLPRILLDRVAADGSGDATATVATARQIGAAAGTVLIGGMLSLLLARHLSDRLAALPRLPAAGAHQVTEATRDSAGNTIVVLRGNGGTGAVADALARGFTDATRFTLLAVAIVLVLGLLAATRITGDHGVESKAPQSNSVGRHRLDD